MPELDGILAETLERTLDRPGGERGVEEGDVLGHMGGHRPWIATAQAGLAMTSLGHVLRPGLIQRA